MIEPVGRIVYDEPGEVWFFVYGSLMWDTPFEIEDKQPAVLRGYHRAFCVSSLMYRGTEDRPGLVLGLDRGGSCIGRAILVSAERRDEVARYLERRELLENIYFCRRVPVAIPAGRISAYAFVVNRDDPIYAGKLPMEETARRIASCAGGRGRNIDYLRNTVRHLDELGIAEGPLHELLRSAEAFDRATAHTL